MTRAMLLCAGLSTRLGPLGQELPKPLLPVCDIPILRYAITNLVAHGVRDLVLNLHHHDELIEQTLGDGGNLGARVRYSREEEAPLGTGGGLRRALPLLDPDGTDEPFLSMNGKLIFDLDVSALLAAYRDDPDALGMLVVREVPDARDWGALRVAREDGRLRVRDVFGEGEHMFCGVHVTRPSVVARLPEGTSCMIRQGYLPWLRAGEPVAAFEAGGYFAEHSTPARYLESNVALLRGARLRHPPGPLRGVDETAHIHPTAILHQPIRIGPGAHIGEEAEVGPDAVVGGHAIVEDGAQVERAVVWTGARASGEVRDCVVTHHYGTVAIDS